ncbi:MAG: hypothetical protein LBN12_05060, partial [Clostridiales Family XIII bacterium]|nr:hypothetical protein [Clostridiales Family XIII bacterium]
MIHTIAFFLLIPSGDDRLLGVFLRLYALKKWPARINVHIRQKTAHFKRILTFVRDVLLKQVF